MRFRVSNKLSLAGLTFVALAAPALSSNVAQVETDLNDILTATANWGNAAKAWAGDFASLSVVTAAGNVVAALTDTAVSDVKATYPFEEADAEAIIALFNNEVAVLTQTTNNFIDKVPVFFNIGWNATSTVETIVQTLIVDFGSLATALKANTPTDLVSQVTNVQNQLEHILGYTVAAFDPD